MRHPSAIVDPSAIIDGTAVIGPYCVIEKGVVIGPGCRLHSHVVVCEGTHIAENVAISSFATIGGLPQDVKFDPATISGVCIGANTVIREGVTLHRATQKDVRTTIGADCLLMAYSHVGHDCILGDRVVLTNAVLLAGHVQIESDVMIGGGACVHQRVHIGQGAMIGGLAAITKHVPPFCLVAERDRLVGLNLIGLRRRQMKTSTLSELKSLYHTMWSRTDYVEQARALKDQALTPEGQQFLSFFMTVGNQRPMVSPNKSRSSVN